MTEDAKGRLAQQDGWNMAGLRTAIEALPIHTIGGYEWECYGDDHYHWAVDCECGRTDPDLSGHYLDRDGRPCDHETLLDRDAVLALLVDGAA